jgi:hypothetical protein
MPNRKIRRLADKKDTTKKPKYSLQDVQRAMNVAIYMKRYTKGHLFSKNLKDKCVFCGSSMKTKKQCDYWFITFLDRLQTVLINPNYFTDKEIEALWLIHGEEYQNIKLPLNITDEKN